MNNDDFLTATELMRKQMESVNQYTKLANSAASVYRTSLPDYAELSSVQKYIEANDSYKFIKEAESMRRLCGFESDRVADYLKMGSIAQQEIESINRINAIKDTLALQKMQVPDYFGDIQRRVESSISSSLQGVLDTIKNSITVKATDAFRIFEEFKSASVHQSIAQQATMSVLGLNSIQEAVGFRTSAIQQAMKTVQQMKLFADTDSITNIIKQMQSTDMLTKSILALNNDNVFAHAVESFNSMAYQTHFPPFVSDDELAENISLIEKAPEGNFLAVFAKLHPNIKAVILFFLIKILFEQVSNISSNLITPYVESAIKSYKLPTSEIQSRKRIEFPQNIESDNLRFIIRNNVKLRAKPGTKSEVLDELVARQIVNVISKKRNWLEVAYTYEDDEQIYHGWVLTTYTAKFQKRAKKR